MTANVIPTWQVQQFSQRVDLLLQQKGSVLESYVDAGSYVGKQGSPVDQLGSVEASEVTSRFSPIVRTDASTDRRWVYPKDYDLAQQVDSFDKLRLLNDPSQKWSENAAMAMGRKKDLNIMNAFFGTAKTGEAGATSTTFTSGNVIGVNIGGTNSKLNVAKIRAAKLILMENYYADLTEDVYLGIPSADHDALLNEIQITSADFNSGEAVLKEGKVTRFLGVNLVPFEAIKTVLAGTDDQSHAGSIALPMWTKSGMHLGTWDAVSNSVDQRKDLQGQPWQIYTKGTFGATRLDEKKVAKIWSYR
jgi:hypothetical protein